MKNLHLIPTEKPSRLSILNSGKLNLGAEIMSSSNSKPQHIYITSDEEIVLNGYHFDSMYGDEPRKTKQRDINSRKYWEKEDYDISKIILTTDQDLIADGVQAIDDEFLEWFVKNPTCDFVEVDRDEREVGNHLGGIATEYGDYKIIIPQEEPKQSTLEEAAAKYVKAKWEPAQEENRESFIAGAKWQEERMYSEEEVFNLCRDFAIFIQQKRPSYKKQLEWFEQFKKKGGDK